MRTGETDDTRQQLTAYLRRVDGVSHVTIGPLALLARRPMAVRLGVPPGRLTGFLIAFVAYGCLVLERSRLEDPRRLYVVVALGNAAFLVCVTGSFASHDLTRVGRLVHLGSATSAVLIGGRAVRGAQRLR